MSDDLHRDAFDDGFLNAVSNAGTASSNAATGAPGRYRLEVAELREAGTPGAYEPGAFRNPFRSAPVKESAGHGASDDGAFDSEQEALEACTEALERAGVAADLSDGPGGAILHQRAPCYRLTHAGGATKHVLVRVGAVTSP